MAALENQFKKTMDESEKVTIAIEELPVEYQPVPTAEMRKEETLVTAQHIENAGFQHWWSVHGSYANNSVIDGASQDTKETGKELALPAFNGTCNRCDHRGHKEAECYAKKHINGQFLAPKNNSSESGMSSSGNGGSNSNQNQKKKHKKAVDHKKENKEAAAVAISRSNVEFLLCAKTEFGCMATGTNKQIFPDSHKLLTQPTIWIGDTAATMDVKPHDIGMINKQTPKESVSIVMGNKQIGCDNQGYNVMHVTMKDVAFVPDCMLNLFSISKQLKHGWSLGSSKEVLVLTSTNEKYSVKFDIMISTPNGCLYAMCIARKPQEGAEAVTTDRNSNRKVKMIFKQVHEKLGHINKCTTKDISKSLGWEVTKVQSLNCSSCTAGKAKRKSLKKVTVVDSGNEKDGYRAYLDLSTVKKNEKYPTPTNPNWRLIVVGLKLQLKFSHFYKTKNAMVEPTCEMLHCWMQSGKIISKLRMDNVGENKKLASRVQSVAWKIPIEIEYTTRDTPQQNSPVEVAFCALTHNARTTMHHVNLPMEMQYQLLFGEIFTTVTLLDGLTVIELNGKSASRCEHFLEKLQG